MSWPRATKVKGFEMHFGESNLIYNDNPNIIPLFKNTSLGWLVEKKDKSFIGGTYLHGIFENHKWRRQWINKIRQQKGLKSLSLDDEENNKNDRERLLDLLTDAFEKNINLDKII